MSGLEHDVFVARWDTGFTDDEITALLGGDFEAFDKLQVLTASANLKAHTGAMVALVPSADDLARLAVEGGEDAAELHLTLAYLGEADLIDEEMRSRIIEAAGSHFTEAFTTEASSIIVFNPHNPDMETAIVLGLKGEGMVDNQASVMSAVRGVYNGTPDQHKPWIPHVTLKYTDDLLSEDQKVFLSRLGPIKFDTLRFAFGGEVVDVPLYNEEPLTAAAPSQLLKYWLGPEGSARVGGWGNEGSFDACIREMRQEGVARRQIPGLCANLYHSATGRWPGAKKEHDVTTAAVTIAEEVVPLPTEAPSLATWEGVLTVEGVESGDGRMFQFGSLDWDTPPMPLMYQPANIGGHSGSVLVGQIMEIYRKGNQLWGSGLIDLNARYNGENIGHEVHRLMSREYLNGVSVDVDKVKDADVIHKFAENAGPMDKPVMTVFQRGRVRGATLVAFPAFVEAQIYLTGEVLTAAGVGRVLTQEAEVMTAASHTITIPDLPPAWWFDEPRDVELKGALTITDEGRVYGLLAPPNTLHRAAGKPIPSNVDYSRWMKGETIVEGGERVVTGVITTNCGHASADQEVYGTLGNRIKHYDNACSVFADARVGVRDDGGVWIAGAVKPYATAEQISAAMSCTLSGDWQPHRDRPGLREFIAALLVPVPGFGMARTAASVSYEDGMVTASAIPVEFHEKLLLEAAARKKLIFAQRLGVDPQSRKVELAARLERSGDV